MTAASQDSLFKQIGIGIEERWLLTSAQTKTTAAQMLISQVSSFAATWCALDKSLHDEERLIDFLHSALVLANGCGYGCKAYGTSAKLVYNSGENTIVYFVQAKGVDIEGLQRQVGYPEVNTPIACGGQVVFPGDILVGDMDGIVVIRPQDAQAILDAAVKKKAGEDKTFALMASDLPAYAAKHLATTEKRKEGKNIAELKSWEEIYG